MSTEEVRTGPVYQEEKIEVTLTDTDKQKIALLLAEYNALRNEITALMGHIWQVTAFSLGAGGIVFIEDEPVKFACGLFAVIVVYGLSRLTIERDISHAAKRLKEIERDINNRVGENLLVWEQLWGMDEIGGGLFLKPKPRCELQGRLGTSPYEGGNTEGVLAKVLGWFGISLRR